MERYMLLSTFKIKNATDLSCCIIWEIGS